MAQLQVLLDGQHLYRQNRLAHSPKLLCRTALGAVVASLLPFHPPAFASDDTASLLVPLSLASAVGQGNGAVAGQTTGNPAAPPTRSADPVPAKPTVVSSKGESSALVVPNRNAFPASAPIGPLITTPAPTLNLDQQPERIGPDLYLGAETSGPRIQVDGARISLADAAALTIAHHPDLAQAAAALARGRAELGAARSVWMPNLSYSANIGPNTFSGRGDRGLNDNVAGPSLSLNQMVYDFGRSRGAIGSARATEQQREFEMISTADNLAELAAVAFLEVKRYETLQLVTQQNNEALDRLRGLIRLRVDAGISDRSDLTLADVRYEGARGDEIQARSAAMAARVTLANLIGGMPGSFEDPVPVIDSFPDREGEPDFANLPVIAAAEQAEKAATARVVQAKAERWPRLGLQLGYTRNNYSYNTHDNSFTAMVTVTGDAYRPANGHIIDAADQERRAALAVKNSAILNLRGRALAAREDIAGGFQRIAAYRKQEEYASMAAQIFFEEYKLGKRTLTDLLNAQSEVYRAASARVGAEYDVMAARVRYENVFGELRRSLGLPSALSEGM